MKKQKNATRIIAIVLVLLMALALVPIAASADAAPADEAACTIHFIANGGNGLGAGKSETQEYTMGEDTTLNENPFTDGTRTFSGWNTHADATAEGAASVAGDASVSVLSSLTTWVGNEITLYAQWVPQYTVTFDANGGSGTYSSTQDINTAATFPPDATFSREGYRFDGWKDEGGLSYTSYTTSTPNAAVTLYAQWVQQCTVTYDAKGGTFTSGSASVTVDKGASSGDLPTVTKTNCTFDGWYNGTTKVTEPFTVDADTTLDAKWTGASVTVAFKPGAASGTDNTFTWLYGEANSLIDNPFTAPDKKIFDGWQVAGGSKQQAGETLVWPEGVYNTLDITAQWADCWRIDFNAHGGSISPSSVLVPQGTAIGEQLKDPTAPTGKTFNGWYTTADYAEDGKVDSTWVPASDRTLHAKWLSNNVTFKFEPGTGATGTKADESVTRGETYTAPTTCTEFTKTNYVFAGWKNKADSSDFTSLETNNDTPDTVTLVAQWKLDAVTVTLSSKDGSKTKETTMYRSKEEHLTPLSETGIVKPAGNVFLGWAKTPDATAAIFTDEESVQWNGTSGENNYAPDSNAVTLYAVFQEKLSGVVTIENNNGELNDSTNPPRVNQTLTAKIDPTSTPLYYRWKINGKAVEGANAQTFTVRPDDNGKNISVDVTNDETFAYVIPSNAYPVKPDPTQSCTVTVKFAGETPSNFTVRVNGDEKTDGQTVADLAQDSTLNVTLEAGADATVYVSKLQLGNTVIEDDEVATVNLIKVPKLDTCDLTVTFAKKTGTNKTATIDPNADTSAAKTSFTTAVKAELAQKVAEKKIPADQQNRYWVNALNVVPCWDNQVTNTLKPGVEPTGQIPAEGLKIENPPLPYPAGSDFNATVAANMPKYYDIEVYHKKTDGTVEVIPDARVTKGTAFTAGVTVTGQTDFSPFGVALTPKALDGALKLDADAAYVGTPIKATYSKTTQGTPNYQWQTKGTSDTDWTNVGTGQTYTPKKDDRNKSLRCVFTSSFETGSVISETVKVGAKPNPEQKQYVINNGNSSYPFAQLGIIGNLSDEMQYYAFPSSSEPTGSSWISVGTGKTESGGLTEGGTYWVRFKDDTENKNWAKVTIGEYFTVTAVPDSVSTNRLYFTASGSYPELIAGKVWRVPKGNSINVTANSGNTNYYKITQLRTKNLKTDYVTVRTINKANTGSTGSFTVNAPYYVSATAGVYGSKTGDTSHLELWVELAALSLMGLGAALVIGRKKLKAQK